MSSTNFTPNYNLPIFIGTDVPSWLVDWNNAMTDIDTAIAAALVAAQTAQTDVGLLQNTVNALQTTVTAIANDVAQNQSDITTLQGQITAFTAMVNQLTADVQALTNRLIADEQRLGVVVTGRMTIGETVLTLTTPTLTADDMISVFSDEYGFTPLNVTATPGSNQIVINTDPRQSVINIKVLIQR